MPEAGPSLTDESDSSSHPVEGSNDSMTEPLSRQEPEDALEQASDAAAKGGPSPTERARQIGLDPNLVRIEESPTEGRYLVANSSLPPSTTILSTVPYAFGIYDSHKKRVCASCLAFNDSGGAFHLHCRNCDQIYACSPACLATLIAEGHHLLCSALRRLATFKAPQHEKSVVKMLLYALFARSKEEGLLTNSWGTILRDAGGYDLEELPPHLSPPPPPASSSSSVPLLSGTGGSFGRSINSPLQTPLKMLDKAALQQHIQQRLRMLTNENAEALRRESGDADHDDQPFLAVMASPKSNTLSPRMRPAAASSTVPPPRPANNPAHCYAQPPLSGGTGSDSLRTKASKPQPTPCVWADIAALESHYPAWPSEDTRDWKKTKNFVIRLCDDCGLLKPEDRVPPGPSSKGDATDFILNLISRIESNGFGLWSPKKEQCMGRAVFPRASYFNHSCDPNAQCLQTQKQMTITTRCAVAADESLTISYIDTNMPLQARRARLRNEYFFICMCERCVLEEKAGSDGKRKVTYERSFTRERAERNTGSGGKGRHQPAAAASMNSGNFIGQPHPDAGGFAAVNSQNSPFTHHHHHFTQQQQQQPQLYPPPPLHQQQAHQLQHPHSLHPHQTSTLLTLGHMSPQHHPNANANMPPHFQSPSPMDAYDSGAASLMQGMQSMHLQGPPPGTYPPQPYHPANFPPQQPPQQQQQQQHMGYHMIVPPPHIISSHSFSSNPMSHQAEYLPPLQPGVEHILNSVMPLPAHLAALLPSASSPLQQPYSQAQAQQQPRPPQRTNSGGRVQPGIRRMPLGAPNVESVRAPGSQSPNSRNGGGNGGNSRKVGRGTGVTGNGGGRRRNGGG